MKKRMFQLAVAMLAVSPLMGTAQQPTRSMPMQNQSGMTCPMGMHGMMMGTMGDGMMNDSAMVAQMRTQLALTEAQVQQLRTIHQRVHAAAQPHMTMAMQGHEAAMKVLATDNPKLDVYEDQLDKAAKHMVQAQVEMAKGMIEFRRGLTPAQRQKLDQMHQQMMHGGMRPG